MMSINGALIATDIVVQLRSNWPDYVFSKEYKLTPLKELEQYINTEKHLPEIPEAKSMEKDGIDVAKINILLTKKVEELTLYMIELNKTNEFLSKRISELENTLTKK